MGKIVDQRSDLADCPCATGRVDLGETSHPDLTRRACFGLYPTLPLLTFYTHWEARSMCSVLTGSVSWAKAGEQGLHASCPHGFQTGL